MLMCDVGAGSMIVGGTISLCAYAMHPADYCSLQPVLYLFQLSQFIARGTIKLPIIVTYDTYADVMFHLNKSCVTYR